MRPTALILALLSVLCVAAAVAFANRSWGWSYALLLPGIALFAGALRLHRRPDVRGRDRAG